MSAESGLTPDRLDDTVQPEDIAAAAALTLAPEPAPILGAPSGMRAAQLAVRAADLVANNQGASLALLLDTARPATVRDLLELAAAFRTATDAGLITYGAARGCYTPGPVRHDDYPGWRRVAERCGIDPGPEPAPDPGVARALADGRDAAQLAARMGREIEQILGGNTDAVPPMARLGAALLAAGLHGSLAFNPANPGGVLLMLTPAEAEALAAWIEDPHSAAEREAAERLHAYAAARLEAGAEQTAVLDDAAGIPLTLGDVSAAAQAIAPRDAPA